MCRLSRHRHRSASPYSSRERAVGDTISMCTSSSGASLARVRSRGGNTPGTASSDMITVKSRRAVFGSKVGCVPSIIWMRSSASRTGSTSDSPRERQLHLAAHPHQQRIVEVLAQLVQRGAHGRLRNEHAFRGARDVPLTQQCIERDEQVEIKAIELHVRES